MSAKRARLTLRGCFGRDDAAGTHRLVLDHSPRSCRRWHSRPTRANHSQRRRQARARRSVGALAAHRGLLQRHISKSKSPVRASRSLFLLVGVWFATMRQLGKALDSVGRRSRACPSVRLSLIDPDGPQADCMTKQSTRGIGNTCVLHNPFVDLATATYLLHRDAEIISCLAAREACAFDHSPRR